ncbi:hypothetical protein [Paenibacillus sp. FSL R5-192]|uniref:hypothetical protein n=1 Tax=Paenibacillus sp. FSL R5-192 TaxID=1226754 RepID=UPI0004AE3BE2|nr:hypothetical protein [Paenibacillus sp. FSL R5-192]
MTNLDVPIGDLMPVWLYLDWCTMNSKYKQTGQSSVVTPLRPVFIFAAWHM